MPSAIDMTCSLGFEISADEINADVAGMNDCMHFVLLPAVELQSSLGFEINADAAGMNDCMHFVFLPAGGLQMIVCHLWIACNS